MSTNIEWAQEVWNPTTGCQMVSEGCRNCYAVGMTHRLGSGLGNAETKAKYAGLTVLNARGDRHFNGVVRTHDDRLDIPLKRKKPTRWFVNSMSDLFHKDVPFEFIDKVFAVMAMCPQHTFQVLTKRPERMAEYTQGMNGQHEGRIRQSGVHPMPPFEYDFPWPLPNVWLGTSVEDQRTAGERIPHLLNCPARVRWLSCEPLLGVVYLGLPITLERAQRDFDEYEKNAGPIEPISEVKLNRMMSNLNATLDDPAAVARIKAMGNPFSSIDWVVAGGESGPKARPMHPDWARSIRDQCKNAGVPFFFKQWGEWEPAAAASKPEGQTVLIDPQGRTGSAIAMGGERRVFMDRVGKKKAGRLLDGVEHNEYPEVNGAT